MIFNELELAIITMIGEDYNWLIKTNKVNNKTHLPKKAKEFLSYHKGLLKQFHGQLVLTLWNRQMEKLKPLMVKRYPEVSRLNLDDQDDWDRYSFLIQNTLRELLWRF